MTNFPADSVTSTSRVPVRSRSARRAAARVLGRLALPVAGLLIIGLIWNAVIWVFDLKPFVLPTPQSAIAATAAHWSVLAPLTAQTVLETVYGFLIGAALGFVLAVAMSAVKVIQRLIFPTLVTSQAVPIVAIAAPLVILFGFGMLPKLIIVAWIVFFPVAVNVLDGLAHVDADLVRLSRVMGARRMREFCLIRLPATLSPLFSGLKIGATYAVTGAVIGEWTGTLTPGLGTHLLKVNASFKTDVVYGITFLLTAIGVISFLLVMAVEAVSTPWTRRTTARRAAHRAGRVRAKPVTSITSAGQTRDLNPPPVNNQSREIIGDPPEGS